MAQHGEMVGSNNFQPHLDGEMGRKPCVRRSVNLNSAYEQGTMHTLTYRKSGNFRSKNNFRFKFLR